ncbi:hypothetical protein [Streptococcus thoraltensis]|uniref:hypothetical protein n=1 Tax=Streptococcus thoraltensis TaxID=55085 RepID=UPI00037D1235|nr:hypothetical protein [Streptococcus thoraltensis]
MIKIQNDIMEHVFTMISQRVSERKIAMKLRRVDISPSASGEQLISYIVNNRIIEDKNPYLLTPNIADDIVESLGFENVFSLIWGDKETRESYFFYLFYKGMEYLDESAPDVVNDCLLDYLPYARARAYSDLDKEYFNQLSEQLASPYFDKKAFKKSRDLAIARLYILYKNRFMLEHAHFFVTKYTTRLNDELKDFFEDNLYKMLSEFSQTSKGKRTYLLIKEILEQSHEHLQWSLSGSQSIYQDDNVIFDVDDFSDDIDTSIDEDAISIDLNDTYQLIAPIVETGHHYIEHLVESQEQLSGISQQQLYQVFKNDRFLYTSLQEDE